MERPKFVLGLKADLQLNGSDSDSDGDFFNSDSDDDGQPFITGVVPLIPTIKRIGPVSIVAPSNKIENFTEASSKITSIVSSFEEIKIPKKNETIFLVPETPATQEIDTLINKYIKGDIQDLEIDDDAFDDNINAQVAIVRYSKSDDEPIRIYEKSKLDSRVMCLLDFLLSKRIADDKIIAYYLLACLESFAKFPSFAPIATLFEDFTIKNVIEQLSQSLINIFPKHPILESVIHSLSTIDPVANSVLEKKLQEEKEKSSLLDDDDDMSDSFFASLKNISASRTAPMASMFIDDSIKNPLDSASAGPKIEKITVKSPPSTMTYLLPDGTDVLGPQQFSTWITSNRSKMKVTPASAIIEKQTQSHSYQSQPLFNVNSSLALSAIEKPKEYDEEYLKSILPYYNDVDKIVSSLPTIEITTFFPLYYPTLELINSKKVSALIKRACPYPKLIESEANAHVALHNQEIGPAVKSIETLISIINFDDWENTMPPQPLKEKRKMPVVHISQPNDNFLSALALADIEFITEGRSPLTGERLTGTIDADMYKSPCVDKHKRISALYKLYTQNEYPPYYAFKIGFAIALGVADSFPDAACDLIFEAVYVLWSSLPEIMDSDPSRQALLFLAEMLEKTDRYYHAVMAFDNFFRSNTSDTSAASAIAQISHRNKDMVRAVFHYTESIKRLIRENKADEVLYLGKTIASIYQDNGLTGLAVSILTYLIKSSYKFTISNKRIDKQIDFPQSTTSQNTAPPNVVAGSMRQPRTKHIQFVQKSNFCPLPNNISTALVGCQCVNLLISCKMFVQAEELLDSIQQSTGPVLSKMLQYLRSKLLLRQNLFLRFLKEFPPISSNEVRRVSSVSRLSVDSGAAFDSRSALIKMLAKAYLNKKLHCESIFWGEAFVLTAPPNSLRETGDGFLIRGQALMYATEIANTTSYPFRVCIPETPQMSSVAEYINPKATLTEEQLVSETLSSLQMARFCFDRVGSIKKSVEASLFYCDYAISLFFDSFIDPTLPKKSFDVAVGTPNMLIKTKVVRQIEQSKYNAKLTQDNVTVELGVMMSVIEKNAARIMNPIYIIYSQILMAKLSLMKKEDEHAKTYYDFAWTNLQKHFTNGPLFVAKNVSFHVLNMMHQIVSLMCETLLVFTKEYINNRLVIFDILNDIEAIIHNRSNNKAEESQSSLTPSIDINPQILELSNPKLPDFGDLLKDVSNVDQSESEIANNNGYTQLLRILNSNIHQFETQKLTEEEMHNRNRSICLKMEQIAESHRRQKQSLNPVDTSFDVGVKHNPALKKMIFFFQIHSNIVIYIPSTGSVRKVPIHVGAKKSSFTIQNKSYNYTFPSSSSLVSPQFIEQMASFIWVDKKHSSLINQKTTKSGMSDAVKTIFGDLMNESEIFGEKCPIVKDENTFGDGSFFKSSALKGSLVTLNAGDPLVFILGRSIVGLPIELMLSEYFVLRASSFTRLLLHKSPASSFPQVNAFRTTCETPEILQDCGIVRSVDIVHSAISSITTTEPIITNLTQASRKLPLPFTLYSSNKTNDVYQEKYGFCKFFDLSESEFPEKLSSASLFIFSYADLIELPEMVGRFMYDYPFSFFVFIPSASIRDAFSELKLIFARQKNRIIWAMTNSTDPAAAVESKLCKNGILFVGGLQRTLMEKLKVPIVVFSPIGTVRQRN